jgi:hypothetical protein
MPVYGEVRDGIAGFNASNTGARGQRSSRINYGDQSKGVPRYEDVVSIRALEQTHTVSLPIDTIQQQVSTTPFAVVPDVAKYENVTATHEKAAEAAEEEFFRGKFNSNRESFDSWLKQVTNGILSVNAGVTELVPTEGGYVGEMYARDGATFTRAPDKHGRLPEPPEPAYWQFSLRGFIEPFDHDVPLRELAEAVGPLGYGRRAREPIPFSRDEIVWMAEDGKEWHEYGFGRVQKVQTLVEIILNQDLSNRKYFPANEVPEGVLNIVEANQDQVDEVREWWNEEIKGERHKVGILGGNGSDIEWMPFRASPEELEFIESQKWYNQLVWMVFGLNQNEVGDISEITRPGGTEQYATKVFQRTTRPLLDLIANHINRQILPFLPAYEKVDGEIKFTWQIDHPEVKARERQRQRDDLTAGLKTVNEVREARGEETYPWGDMPEDLRKSVFRRFPRYALEEFTDVEELPEEQPVQDPLASLVGGGEDRAGPAVATVDGGTPARTDVFEEPEALLQLAEEVAATKEPLRNERWRGEFPNLVGHMTSLENDLAPIFEEQADDLEEFVADEFPEENRAPDGEHKAPLPNVDAILDAISLAPTLREIVTDANLDAMSEGAEFHAEDAEEELAERLEDEDIEVELSFDVEDSFAARHLEQRSASKMRNVEESVKLGVQRTLLSVANDGGTVTDATAALREKFDQFSEGHSRLIARTESLESARHGSQALAESSELIASKSWNSTDDGRGRDWHVAMDGVTIPKEEEFTVPQLGADGQPSDYPRSTLTVGGDQPYNCRCGQRPELAEDLPTRAADLMAEYKGVLVYRRNSKRASVAREHRRSGETLLEAIERVITENDGSITATADTLEISKPTLYDWRDGGLAVSG